MAMINYLTTIRFEAGALSALAEEMAAVGIARPLVVTDPGIVSCGLLDRLLAALPERQAATIFDETPGNPTEAAVEAALQRYKAVGCDGLIAIGGGSSMDLAKAVGVMVTHEGPIEDYMAILGGVPRITAAVAPLIAIPTTAGTGSEVGRGAVITLKDGRKLTMLSPHLIPKRAICDPELTLGLPPLVTAATGMDAMTHCIETFISPVENPPAAAIALDGVGRAGRWIERATKQGDDLEARWHMMMAALHGGLTFQKGLGAVHAMSHPLGALREPLLHHGTLNAVILPAVLRFNANHVGDKYDELRRVLGLEPGADLSDTITGLNARLGLPANLREMGVTDEMIPAMVEGALVDHTSATNARKASREDYQALYAEAMG